MNKKIFVIFKSYLLIWRCRETPTWHTGSTNLPLLPVCLCLGLPLDLPPSPSSFIAPLPCRLRLSFSWFLNICLVSSILPTLPPPCPIQADLATLPHLFIFCSLLQILNPSPFKANPPRAPALRTLPSVLKSPLIPLWLCSLCPAPCVMLVSIK